MSRRFLANERALQRAFLGPAGQGRPANWRDPLRPAGESPAREAGHRGHGAPGEARVESAQVAETPRGRRYPYRHARRPMSPSGGSYASRSRSTKSGAARGKDPPRRSEPSFTAGHPSGPVCGPRTLRGRSRVETCSRADQHLDHESPSALFSRSGHHLWRNHASPNNASSLCQCSTFAPMGLSRSGNPCGEGLAGVLCAGPGTGAFEKIPTLAGARM